MDKLIACCGLNCASCEARIATINDDDELRKATAEKWETIYNASGITAEMINCTGCRMEGVKLAHCSDCEILKCVKAKGFNTCADCPDLDDCETVAIIHKHSAEALLNLKNLN
jgi:hypothetical protein